MDNLSLLPFTSFLLLQIEIHNFFATLLNGVYNQSVLLVYNNDTQDMVHLVLSSPCFQKHLVEIENFDIEPEKIYWKKYGAENAHKYTFLTIFLLSAKDEYDWVNWIQIYAERNPKMKVIWVFNTNMKRSFITGVVTSLAETLRWYHLVMVHFSYPDRLIEIYRKRILHKSVEIISYRFRQYKKPGVLFKRLFNNSFTHFDGLPIYIYAEPDMPKVTLLGNQPTGQQMVTGSYISLAIMIGRYVNATVNWITGWKQRVSYPSLPKEQKIPFHNFIFKEIHPKNKIHEILPWQLNTNKNE